LLAADWSIPQEAAVGVGWGGCVVIRLAGRRAIVPGGAENQYVMNKGESFS
jgi:hypothetical protein